MTPKKRPTDPNQLAKHITDIATGKTKDTISPAKRKQAAASKKAGKKAAPKKKK